MRWIFGSQNQTGRIGSTTLIMNPNLQMDNILAKNNQQRRSLDHVHTRTSSLHQSISAHTQMKLCRWDEGKHAVCAVREEGCLPPRSRRSRAPTTTCRRRRLSSFSTNTSSSSVCLVLGERCNRDCQESGRWQGSRSRHHHYTILSARGQARKCVPADGGTQQQQQQQQQQHEYTPMILVCSAHR